MDERHLLLLGLLMTQSQHGYKINEFIDNNLMRVSNMKRPTAYSLLERLHKQGFVSVSTEVAGNHPPRKVYSITDTGKARFFELLQTLLMQVDYYSSSADIALMFLDFLPLGAAVQLMEKRVDKLQNQITELEMTPKHENASAVDLAIQRKIAILKAEQKWLTDTIAHLQKQIQDTEVPPS